MLMAHDLIDEIEIVKNLESMEYLDLLASVSDEEAERYIQARSWSYKIENDDKKGLLLFKSHGDYELWVGSLRAILIHNPSGFYTETMIWKLLNYMRFLNDQDYHDIWNDLWRFHYDHKHTSVLSSYEHAIHTDIYTTNLDEIQKVIKGIDKDLTKDVMNINNGYIVAIIIDMDGYVWYARRFGDSLDSRQTMFSRIDGFQFKKEKE